VRGQAPRSQEPWLLALAVQVGVLLGGFYLLVRFVKAAWQD
jgi:hypothetical protein